MLEKLLGKQEMAELQVNSTSPHQGPYPLSFLASQRFGGLFCFSIDEVESGQQVIFFSSQGKWLLGSLDLWFSTCGVETPLGVVYQIACISDSYIRIHSSSKFSVMK